MIVDAFTVVGGYPIRPIKVGIDQLRSAMNKNDVDIAMTMSLLAVQTDVELGNDFVFKIARDNARILPVAVLDPRNHTRIERMIDTAVRRRAAALAFHLTAIPCPPSSILFRNALTKAATTRKPLIFVTNTPGQLTQIAQMTRDSGCEKVLLAGVSYHLLGELMALLEEFEHVHVETSWQVSPGSVALLAKAGHAGRVLFGSMSPLRPVRPSLNMIADAELTNSEKADIFARNSLRFLGRDEQADEVGDDVPKVMGIPSVPAIDVHCHFRVMPEQPSTCLGPADVQKELERFNIELAVVSSTAAYKDNMDAGNEEMVENIEAHDRMLGSVVVNPHDLEGSIKWLNMAATHPRIAHVTVNPLTTYERYCSPGWMRLFAEIATRQLPVFYNTGGQDIYRRSPVATQHGHLFKVRGAPPDEVDMFRRIDKSFPEMPIIVGHGHGLEGLELAGTCRNIYLDLCSTYPEQDVYRRAIDAVGSDRILFGTDLELISPAFVLGSIWEAQLTEEQQRMILRENARRILKLP